MTDKFSAYEMITFFDWFYVDRIRAVLGPLLYPTEDYRLAGSTCYCSVRSDREVALLVLLPAVRGQAGCTPLERDDLFLLS